MLLSPTHVAPQHRESVSVRVCVGSGPAHTGIPWNSRGNFPRNPARIVIRCKFNRSVARSSSQAGDDGCPRMRQPLIASWGLSGYRGHLAGLLNWRSRLDCWSIFRALHHALQKPCRRLAYRLESFASVFAHVEQHAAKGRLDVGYE